MGKSAPEAPDYTAAAEATAEGSKEVTANQTYANRPDQINPWGSTTWDANKQIDPSTGKPVTGWTQTQTLAPDAQAALDSQMELQKGRSDLAGGMMNNVSDELGTQMDWDKYGDIQGGVNAEGVDTSGLNARVNSVNNSDQYRQSAEDAGYDRRTSRLDPMYDQKQQALEIKLANQGLAAGDEAYDDAIGNFDRGRNDAYSSAMNDSIMAGGAEASRTMDMDLGAGNFSNTSRTQGINEQMGLKDRTYQQGNEEVDRANAIRTGSMNEELNERSTSLNEVNALISGQQVQSPNMAPVTQASKSQGANYLGAANNQYSAALDASNAKNMGVQGMMSGLTSAASTAAMFSDRRLKKNIKKIGEFLTYNIYKFQYLWGAWAVGVMSDEINQDAVIKHASGYDMVDYGKIA